MNTKSVKSFTFISAALLLLLTLPTRKQSTLNMALLFLEQRSLSLPMKQKSDMIQETPVYLHSVTSMTDLI